jgi:hypothetical protein
VRTRPRARVGCFSLLRSSLGTMSVPTLSLSSPYDPVASPSSLSRRIQPSLRLAAAARAQTAPRARADRTSPRSCCLRRSEVEDGRDPGRARRHW